MTNRLRNKNYLILYRLLLGLRYRLWQGWDWGFNLFFGVFFSLIISALVFYIVGSDPVAQIANYLATSPAFYGMPFQWRLAILGEGLFLLLALIAAIYELVKYFYIRPRRITNEDLDNLMTAVYKRLDQIEDIARSV